MLGFISAGSGLIAFYILSTIFYEGETLKAIVALAFSMLSLFAAYKSIRKNINISNSMLVVPMIGVFIGLIGFVGALFHLLTGF